MLNIPFEAEDCNNRLNKTKVFKNRNKNFGTLKYVKSLLPNKESILRKLFDVRSVKTPGGCPSCGMPYYAFKKVIDKPAYRCRCGYKIYPLKGTHLEESRTDLMEMIELVYELFCCKHGTPAFYLERKYGHEYDTWLSNLHKIDDWMGWSNEFQNFTPGSIIELDEVFPKAETGLGEDFNFSRGLGSERTHGTLVMTERDDPSNGFYGITKAFVFDKYNTKAVQELIEKYIKPESKHQLFTDESNYYDFLKYNGYHHCTINHGKYQYKNPENPDSHTGTVEGYNKSIKTHIHSIYNGVHPEYLQLYVNRITFNHCNRAKTFMEALDVLFDTLPGFHQSVKKGFISYRAKKLNYRKAA